MNDPQPSLPSDLDQGLAAAFGRTPDTGVSGSQDSVLLRLRRRSGVHLGVDLPGAEATAEPLALDPKDAEPSPSSRYHLNGEIARGGVGVVYRGRDEDLGRDVALKVLLPEHADRDEVLARFVEEAQIGGQLQHPGIVPVYELGLQADDRPYFAMKLVKGDTLAALLRRRESPTQERRRFLGIFEQICQTMAYAHHRAVVHRDLKPANVMVGCFGEVQVVDWGFAKVLRRGGRADDHPAQAEDAARSVIATARSRSGGQSMAGSVLGTPAYMPPEQARGEVESMDERSDVFALGALLCEILTGEPLYSGTQAEALQQAERCATGPARERLKEAAADEALVSLVTDCLKQEPTARPADAEAVARRVGAWIEAVEERAREARLRAAKAHWRTQLVAGAAGVVVLLFVGATMAWTWWKGEVRDRQQEVAAQVDQETVTSDRLLGEARALLRVEGTDQAGLARLVEALAAGERAGLLSRDAGAEVRERATARLEDLRRERTAAVERSARLTWEATLVADLLTLRFQAFGAHETEHKQATATVDRLYQERFREAGVDLDAEEPEAVAARLRGSHDAELIGSLADWGMSRRTLLRHDGEPTGPWQKPLEVALLLATGPEHDFRRRISEHMVLEQHDRDLLEPLRQELAETEAPPQDYVILADFCWIHDERSQAIAVLEEGQLRHPGSATIQYLMGTRQESMGRHDLALAAFMAARAVAGGTSNDVLLAHALSEQDQHAQALELLESILEDDPSDARAWFYKGAALESLGRTDEAIEALWEASDRRPDWPNPYGVLAGIHRDLGQMEELGMVLQQGHEECPFEPVLAHDLAVWHFNAQDLEAARDLFEEALRLRPDYELARVKLGETLRHLEDFEAAIQHLEKVPDSHPETTKVRALLGTCWFYVGREREQSGDTEGAIQAYRNSIEADEPNSASAYFNIGCLTKTPEDSIQYYEKAIELEHGKLDARFNMGIELNNIGERERATEQFQFIFDQDPRFGNVAFRLGTILLQRGLFEEAVPPLEEAVLRDPEGAEAHCNLGGAYQHSGRYAEAVASFRRGHELGIRRPGWTHPSARWIEEAEALLKGDGTDSDGGP